MDKQWLESQFILHPEKKKADLAKALDLEPPAVSKILGGIREIKAPEYLEMRKFFGLPVDGDASLGVSKRAFVIKPFTPKKARKSMQDGGKSAEDNWVIPSDLMKQKTSASPEKIQSFKVQEDMMAPDFNAGEYVLVDTSIKKPSPSGVFLMFDGLGEILRQCEYIPQSAPPQIRVTSLKKGSKASIFELKDNTIIGRVIAKVQWVG